MSENHNSQPTKNRPQPPRTIGKPPKTEFINSEQQQAKLMILTIMLENKARNPVYVSCLQVG